MTQTLREQVALAIYNLRMGGDDKCLPEIDKDDWLAEADAAIATIRARLLSDAMEGTATHLEFKGDDALYTLRIKNPPPLGVGIYYLISKDTFDRAEGKA
jgi:hypothetical protein